MEVRGGAQLMGDVGDEVAAGLLHTLRLREITQHGNGAATRHGRRGHIKGASGNNGSGARRSDSQSIIGTADGGEKIRIANSFNDGGVQASSLRHQSVHAAVSPLHTAIAADSNNGILHTV